MVKDLKRIISICIFIILVSFVCAEPDHCQGNSPAECSTGCTWDGSVCTGTSTCNDILSPECKESETCVKGECVEKSDVCESNCEDGDAATCQDVNTKKVCKADATDSTCYRWQTEACPAGETCTDGECDGGAPVGAGHVLEVILVSVVIEMAAVREVDILDVRAIGGYPLAGVMAVVEHGVKVVGVHEDGSLVGQAADLPEVTG